MRFDVDWLLDHLEGDVDPDVLADRLTACGFLVELRDKVDGSEVWDVEVTTNRPDAMNHRGLAREAAVACRTALRPLDASLEEADPPAVGLATVEVVEPELCPRYVARVVRGAVMTESPDWLKTRLQRCGVRPINAVVDATNYVLLGLGQPLHAFDLERVTGRRIIVRRAAAGERLTTLDEQSRQLDSSDLVIADAERAVALAGIMGGADSEIGAGTRDILIESAHFDPLTVRRTARRLGMHTEASHRFERGSDPEMAALACDAVAALITRLAGGTVCQGRIDVHPLPREARRLTLSIAQLSAFAGLEIAAADVVRILEGLEFEPEASGEAVSVTVPSHRVDVERVADLYEEVLRHVGYGEVPSQLPVLATNPGHRNPNWELVDRGRDAAVAAGLTEVMTWSFIDPEDDRLTATLPLCPGAPVELVNPLVRTQAVMRRSLLPGMLAAATSNLNQGERALALFEQGRVFCAVDDTVVEAERIGVVVSAGGDDGSAGSFHELKGVVEEIFERVAFPEVRWRRGGAPWLDEAEGAVIESASGAPVGCAGLLAAELTDRWSIKQPVYVAELDLTAALAEPPATRFRALPRFPSVVADVTVEHRDELSFTELETAVRELAADTVEGVELLDRFTGGSLPSGTVRTTLRLVYRHPERSLTQDEVNSSQERLRARLAERLGVRFA